jgi:ribosomal protein S18 acetylase RimI-like enzyme
MPHQVVPFAPKFARAAAGLHFRAFREIGMSAKQAKSDFEKLPPTAFALVAVYREEVLGYATAGKNGRDLYLGWFAVNAQTRRRGVGRALLKELEKRAKKQKIKTITLDTRNRFRPANIFYLKNGFAIVGTWLNADGETMIRFRKNL